MPAAERAGEAIADHELASLFSDFVHRRRVLLAVSGGPDSTALLLLAQRWRKARRNGPDLVAATVDHRLRPESRREAAMVAKLAKTLGIPHRILVWTGKKPATGLQEAAREARYRLLEELAQKTGSDVIATAHTRDDQAETVLMRLVRGSGIAGLAGIKRLGARGNLALLRPLIDVPKARLIATLRAANIPFVDDPSNRDPRFLRVRLRAIAKELAAEGLDHARLVALARRMARADAALEAVTDEVQSSLSGGAWPEAGGPIELAADGLFRVPEEISMRILGRAIERSGDEVPVELGKLEALHAALRGAHRAKAPLRRTLAGAVVSLDPVRLVVGRAPARRRRRPPA